MVPKQNDFYGLVSVWMSIIFLTPDFKKETLSAWSVVVIFSVFLDYISEAVHNVVFKQMQNPYNYTLF